MMNFKYILLILLIPIFSELACAQTDYLQYWQGLKLISENKKSEAIPYLEKASAKHKQNIQIQLDLAEAYILISKNEEAKTILVNVNKKKPHAADLLLAEISLLENNKVACYQYLYDLQNSKYAVSYIEIKQIHKFEPLHNEKQWLSLWKNTKHQLELQAEIAELIHKKKYNNAFNLLDIELSKKRINTNYYLLRAQAHLETKQLKNALFDLNIVLEKQSKNTKALLLKTQVYLQDEKYKKAELTALKLLKSEPEKLEYHILYAKTLALNNKLEEARNKLQSTDSLIITNYKNILLLAESYFEAEDYLATLKTLNNAQQLIANSPELLLLRAQTYLETNNIQQATSDLNLLLDLSPNNAEAYFLKGNILYNQNQTELACKYWKKALKLNHKRVNEKIQIHCR